LAHSGIPSHGAKPWQKLTGIGIVEPVGNDRQGKV
jgi:hypothetical protein